MTCLRPVEVSLDRPDVVVRNCANTRPRSQKFRGVACFATVESRRFLIVDEVDRTYLLTQQENSRKILSSALEQTPSRAHQTPAE